MKYGDPRQTQSNRLGALAAGLIDIMIGQFKCNEHGPVNQEQWQATKKDEDIKEKKRNKEKK